MKKLKHLKLRNTGIIYETLLRQITVDVLEGKTDSPVFGILREYFSKKTLMSEELGLYNSIVEFKTTNKEKTDYFLKTVIDLRKRFNESELAKEKYNIIKEIKKHYDLDNLFNSKVDNYKVLASVYKLFEAELNAHQNYNPTSVVQTRYTIIEHITNPTVNTGIEKIDTMVEKYKQQDKEIRIIAYNMLIEKFNTKYNSLNGSQKKLLKMYIDSMSDTNSLKEYIETEVPRVTEALKAIVNDISSEVIKIKLTELLKHTDSLKCGKRVKDSQITNLMKLYELEKEIGSVLGE